MMIPLFILIGFLILASPSGAVTRDTSTQGQGNTSPLTVAHTVTNTGGNRAIFVYCALRSITVTLSATYNGVSVPLIRSDAFVSGSATSTWMFGLANPAVGTNNWVVTQSGGTANIVCGALSATDVNQAALTTDNKGACTLSVTSATQTLTTTVNDLLLDVEAVAAVSESLTKGAGQSNEISPNPLEQTNLTGGASSQSGSVDGVMSWSYTTSAGNCQSAISIAHSAFSSGRRSVSPMMLE